MDHDGFLLLYWDIEVIISHTLAGYIIHSKYMVIKSSSDWGQHTIARWYEDLSLRLWAKTIGHSAWW